jgi:hypothetical protein
MSNNHPNNHVIDEDFTVSYGREINKKGERVQCVPFQNIIDQIHAGSGKLEYHISKLRALPAEERKTYKAGKLPYFTMALYRDNHRTNKNFTTIQHIILDFDHVGDKLAHVRQQMMNDGRVYCLFTSASGDGLKVIYRLDRPIVNPEVYRNLYEYHRTSLSAEYGIKSDEGTHDAARACFLSYDPDVCMSSKQSGRTWL